jgi:hypothetical protein
MHIVGVRFRTRLRGCGDEVGPETAHGKRKPERNTDLTTTETTNPYPDVRGPAGAVWVDEWEQPGTPDSWRIFDGSGRVIVGAPEPLSPGNSDRDIRLFIGGIQNAGGAVHRNIVPPDLHPDRPISLGQAAELGLAFLELVNEAQKMAKLDLHDDLDAQK